ncbi:hypothetical protein [uncultured Methanobrevibacter sp.]|uniref:hypothetical protein n=1 Tax=uncultured Methanobrevibacter sp. TaxID=253161 RepID=UPI002620D802|nr:hypothetical protein [uncultured Methanobrevibacter sp.]
MNNELQIVTGEDLLASIDDGTNRLFINSTEIDSSNWVGSGTYTTTISGHNISIVKIDSLDGNIGLKRLSEYNYELFRYETGSITADDVIGLKSFIEADDINVADNYATFTEASSRTNIDSGDSLKVIFGKIKKFFSDLKTVAFTGAYADLTGQPTIPAAANNGKLTIQKNGTNVATFTANQSGDATANIEVPTNTNQLTNGAGFITSSGSCNYANTAGSATDSSKEPKHDWKTSGNWHYYKDSANVYHLHYHAYASINYNGSIGNLKYRTSTFDINLPVTLNSYYSITVSSLCGNDIAGATIQSASASQIKLWLWAATSGTKATYVEVNVVSK